MKFQRIKTTKRQIGLDFGASITVEGDKLNERISRDDRFAFGGLDLLRGI